LIRSVENIDHADYVLSPGIISSHEMETISDVGIELLFPKDTSILSQVEEHGSLDEEDSNIASYSNGRRASHRGPEV
jgi:hypothetical protein